MRTVLGFLIALTSFAPYATALDGDVRLHDPSTVIQCDGRYYVFSTGRGIPILSSDDGWTWKRSGRVFDAVPDSVHSLVPLNNGHDVWAPDVTKMNGEYYLYYAISHWGSEVSAIGLMTNPTLNASDAKYKWTDRGLVIHSVKGQKLNTIDPGILQAPDGTLWLSYGSYIGDVEVVQLDPKTGLRISSDSPRYDLSSRSEASDIIYHDGYYYLFVNRGSCCQGANSTYNIRMGRSKVVTGPYLDRYGNDMARGGGDLFLASAGNQIGPGHFGRLIDDGVEEFSCHYEADLTRRTPVLDIRPLLWNSGDWPMAGINLSNGTYQFRCLRTGLNLSVTTHAAPNGPLVQEGDYLARDNQKWTLVRVGRYFRIAEGAGKAVLEIAPGNATLEMAADAGSDRQLWKIDEVSDGYFRIESKANQLSLTATVGGRDIGFSNYSGDDSQKWLVSTP
jgi:arabinan endo-1,5-alpha-L-arabinosidase